VRTVSVVRFAMLALLWGSNFLLIKVAVEGLSPIQLVLVRLTLGALVLLVFAATRHELFPRDPATWAHLAVAAAVANVIPYFLFGWGEQRVTSNVAGVFNATTPLFTLVLALATGTERGIGLRRAGGLLIGFLGALVVLAPWRVEGFAHTWTGQLACLVAAASYGVSYVYMRRFLTGRGSSPLVLAASQLAASAVLVGVVAPFVARQSVTLTPAVIASVGALGALGTGVAYVLNYRLITDEGATTTSTVTYFLPIVAIVLGILVLSEPISWNLLVGTLLVLLGVAISESRIQKLRDVFQQPHERRSVTK
jgi:drug/metabolite transporter (DMT)-like permease